MEHKMTLEELEAAIMAFMSNKGPVVKTDDRSGKEDVKRD